MTDDIVTQLTNDIAFRLRVQAKVSNLYEIRHPHMVRVPTIYEEAADEIERLRKLAHNLYEETKRCGSLHDTPATMDYEEWLEENE